MRILVTILAVLVVLAALVVVGVYSGAYDVAADVPHGSLARWLFSTTQERSVRHAAAGIEAPPLDDSARLAEGAEHYRHMCETCHGAPGVDRSEIGQGLNPRAPGLIHADREWTQSEMFWMVKHGIKMTGMPAFGKTHDDEKIWSIVAFVSQFPDMSPAEYQAQTGGGDSDEEAEGEASHHHEGEDAEHGGAEDEPDGHEHGAAGS